MSVAVAVSAARVVQAVAPVRAQVPVPVAPVVPVLAAGVREAPEPAAPRELGGRAALVAEPAALASCLCFARLLPRR
jgi:hypothetical protein